MHPFFHRFTSAAVVAAAATGHKNDDNNDLLNDYGNAVRQIMC